MKTKPFVGSFLQRKPTSSKLDILMMTVINCIALEDLVSISDDLLL